LRLETEYRYLAQVDWNSISEIYLQGIRSGNATFETEVPSWGKWDASHLKSCRLITLADGVIVAWAALVPVSARKVYSGVAEVSIYVSDTHKGKGIGKSLLEKLISESETEGIWTLQAVIFPENGASLKIHQDLGFRKVGYREKIAMMNGTWRDTVLLERRSKKYINIP
jgi:L-amino acid N-acyltransferase YncA